jgi:anthranilate/para-aminobenzoate synthase component I
MVRRETALLPDVFALGQRLAHQPGLAILASSPWGAWNEEDARYSFLASDPVDRTNAFVPDLEGHAGARSGYDGGSPAPVWIGCIPYEAGRSLERRPDQRPASRPIFREPEWYRYDAVARIDHRRGIVVIEGDDRGAVDALHEKLCRAADPFVGSARLRELPDEQGDSVHCARIGRALDYIGRGDVYQVNVARRFRFEAEGTAFELFAALFARAPSTFGFCLRMGERAIAGSSPELALEIRGDLLRTIPIKGTALRGGDAAADHAQAQALCSSEKERAELAMAIDVHRNDLGRIATIGSVRPRGAPRLMAGRTVWSRGAEVMARRRSGLSDADVVRAMFPFGSVTGAPKIRAMEVIAELERDRRGLYTGVVGYVGARGALKLAMAIRTFEFADGVAEYGAGGGIVAGSQPEHEVAETHWKAVQARNLARGGGAA